MRVFMNTTRGAEGELFIHSVRSPWVTMPGPLGVKPQARQGLRKLTFELGRTILTRISLSSGAKC